MMKVLALRHLSTELNQKSMLQGRMDTAISRDSIDEAVIRQNQSTIDQLCPEKVFVSPLVRTKETALLYGITGFEVDERLTEFDFGTYEGKPKEAMLEKEGKQWLNSFSKVTFGEGFESFSKRVDNFIEETCRRYQVVLIISHGVVIRYLLGKFKHEDIDRINQLVVKTNSLNIIEIY